ncbi:hypothetical protein [Actinoallomurus iriomotensis]|uniref:Uncharacterized protein n=1 Tax=Actinoallomurus iriomotensis TaxID=478107 RepID=A0A9W6RG41_9ACTN|nr:hypothetical protein [Actinoallomurus iriomotensis]GLY75123.1 hypothetical protein Airi01_033900 [Actinoallomurus iriomotensis]
MPGRGVRCLAYGAGAGRLLTLGGYGGGASGASATGPSKAQAAWADRFRTAASDAVTGVRHDLRPALQASTGHTATS